MAAEESDKKLVIAIDCMGGDIGPSATIPAVVLALHQYPQVDFQLFGDYSKIEKQLESSRLKKQHPARKRLQIIASDNDVEMSDQPAIALKSKKTSSMRLALEAVRDGQANACVSAGNTGALMAISRFILKMLPGIDRPAIISAIPTLKNDHVYMLDLGANVDCDEKRLTQFAIMGDQLAKCLDKDQSPKVGLLNVGEEEYKGSEKLRKAAQMIESLKQVNYVGFAEGNQIFSGDFRVIVTDGFTGNNVLKTSEGLSQFLSHKIKSAFERNLWTKFCGFLATPVIKALKKEINPEKYNGACLVGLRGIVIKSHGSANVNATFCAIEEAIVQSRQKLPLRIKEQLQSAVAQFNH